METPITEEIALRIGLAARALPDITPGQLLDVVGEAVGFPPTKENLAKLTIKQLKQGAEGLLAEVDKEFLAAALAHLKGTEAKAAEPLPEPTPYQDGAMADSIRIAFASNSGEDLNGHFGSCKRFLVYQVSGKERQLIDVRETDDADNEEDKNAYRARLIEDCQVVFVNSIGGPAAAKVVRAGVHPIKHPAPTPVIEQIDRLQVSIASAPPPWLAKAMGMGAEDRVRFAIEDEEE